MTSYATAAFLTKLFLYGGHLGPNGAFIVPELLTDRLRMPNDAGVTIEIAASDYMNSYGAYAVPARAQFVQDFFSNFVPLAPGTYTVAQLKTIYVSSVFSFSFNHAQVDIGNSNYLERAYTFGHSSFFLTDETKFTVASNGARSMSDVRVMPAGDNFDFLSSGLA